jgi:hypothetical protein
MGRRSTPDRVYQARRAALLSRLVQADHLSEQLAERLVAAWEADALRRGLEPESSAFWDGAEQWILQQRRTR